MLATKVELKAEQDKMGKLQALDSCYFRGKRFYDNDGFQNMCLFINQHLIR